MTSLQFQGVQIASSTESNNFLLKDNNESSPISVMVCPNNSDNIPETQKPIAFTSTSNTTFSPNTLKANCDQSDCMSQNILIYQNVRGNFQNYNNQVFQIFSMVISMEFIVDLKITGKYFFNFNNNIFTFVRV